MTQTIVSTESLGLALRAARKRKKLSQKAVGHAVGMEQHTVSKIEKGNPGTGLGTLFRLLSALELDLVVQPRRNPSDDHSGDNW
jgi:HTH-type transcriptional regulator/antitoxin HipB